MPLSKEPLAGEGDLDGLFAVVRHRGAVVSIVGFMDDIANHYCIFGVRGNQ